MQYSLPKWTFQKAVKTLSSSTQWPTKDSVLIRPVVNYTSAPAYKAAKKLGRVIKAGIKLEENYSLKNTYEFFGKTRNLRVSSSHRMCSLDITNLYTNVPVDETLVILERILKESGVYDEEIIKDVIELLKIALGQNYFTFNSKFYHQKEGLAMGSPLSGLLVDIFMNNFERE